MDLRTILTETITELWDSTRLAAEQHPTNAYLHFYRYVDQMGALHKIALKADLDDIAKVITDDIEFASALAAANTTAIATK